MMTWILLAAWGPVRPGQDSIVRDYRGREFRTDRAPKRVVSLAPNITEILFALGAGGQVAAVTRFCDYPPEAAEKIRIGGFLDPDIERIRDVAPDLIAAFRGNPLEKIERLDSLGLSVFVLDIGYRLEEIPPLVEKIGAVIGRNAEAASLARSLSERTARVAASLSGLRNRPRVFLKLQGEGLWTCGRESYFTDLIDKAGGVSVTSGIEKNWLEYGAERLVRDNPDVFVILSPSAVEFERTKAWLKSRPGIRETTAVRNGRIVRLDENPASRFGPRLIDSLEDLARLLHPDRFKSFPKSPGSGDL
ncbi:MAG: ABC transporter substrate-binding protein [Candidatus Aminicenantes bacterium]|nr:ABC transporter substrate-binding protein [Candidatus Aminicenantes bacterium]